MGTATAAPGPSVHPDDAPWAPLGMTYESVRKVVNKAIWENLPLFGPYPDVTRDDLMQDCLLGVWQSLSRKQQRRIKGRLDGRETGFDASRVRASTWVHHVATMRLRDRLTVLARRHRRDTVAIERQTITQRVFGDEETLIEWLDDIYNRAKYAIERYCPTPAKAKARKDYSDLAQATAMLALQHKTGLSTHEMTKFLADRPALLKIVGLPESPPPSAMFFSRCKSRVTQINFSNAPSVE
jgi:hypothetical protein